ncbi:riboflavin synthase [Streptomyces sp. AJS327]|uniref:riboflavin synthase n=1 Tax=Streptomyces sp. AJS327 TaxID=2545265 RepID=UPI0015DE5E75|nr:riboflavin synthase [Streptomyces sp. AJS327]MBA0050846.1 riboflavin synthase [Streptomyces sp. AJS327]
MFTGIVEELGEVVEIAALEGPEGVSRFRFHGPRVTEGVRHGDSIAVNGACLTVVEAADGGFTADVIAETLRRTALGALTVGSRVNLERPMTLGGRLDGHLVQGHVDGTGTVAALGADGVLRVELPAELARYVVEKGSIAIDGVSLTVVEAGERHLTVGLIPTTLELTNLGGKRPGDPVNLETDVLAKYVERLLGPAGHAVAGRAGREAV